MMTYKELQTLNYKAARSRPQEPAAHTLLRKQGRQSAAFCSPCQRSLKALTISMAVIGVLLSINSAGAAPLPGGYTCTDLRSKVSQYGEIVVISMAKSRGFTDQVISQIRRKCRI